MHNEQWNEDCVTVTGQPGTHRVTRGLRQLLPLAPVTLTAPHGSLEIYLVGGQPLIWPISIITSGACKALHLLHKVLVNHIMIFLAFILIVYKYTYMELLVITLIKHM